MEPKERLTYQIAIAVKEREVIEAAEAFMDAAIDADAIADVATEYLRASAHLANLRVKAAQAFAVEDMDRAIGVVGSARSAEWIQGALAGMGVKWTPPEPEKVEPEPTEDTPLTDSEAQS